MANYIAKENIISGDLERAQSTHADVPTVRNMSKHLAFLERTMKGQLELPFD